MDASENNNGIIHGNLWKQQLLFFVPILFSLFFQQLYTMVDAVIVGQFAGKEGLAAIDATGSLVRLFVNLFTGLSTGAAILISQQHGAMEREQASRTTQTAMAIAIAGGLGMALLGLLLSPMGVTLMQVPPDIAASATAYLRFYSIGLWPSMVYNMGAGIMRAVGDSRRPAVYLLAGGVLNVLLDLLFVAAFGWGVAGAAIATIIAQAVSAVLVLRALMRGSALEPLQLARLRIARDNALQILRKGVPIGLQSALYPISNMIVHARINRLGTDTVAAWAVSGKLDLPIWLVMDALAVTISTFAAQNYGANRLNRVKASVRVCICIALGIVIPLSLALYFWGEPLSLLFMNDAQVASMSARLLQFCAPFFFTFSWGEVLSGAIRGTGETLRPMIITLLCTCLLRIVWTLWLIPADATAFQIIAAYPVTWVVTSLAFVVYYFIYKKRLVTR